MTLLLRTADSVVVLTKSGRLMKILWDIPVSGSLLSERSMEELQLSSLEIAPTIAHVFVKAMKLLLKDEVHHERIWLVATDARYTMKAGKSFRLLLPRMVHVTRTAHGLHRVSEFDLDLFPRVHLLAASMKMKFLKAHSRHVHLKEHLSMPIFPKSALIRRGTRITGVLHVNFSLLT